MNISLRLVSSLSILAVVTFAVDIEAQNIDTRQEYVRSSSPTKSGGRVISESVGGKRMVRIANASGSTASTTRRVEPTTNGSRYKYPDRAEAQQVTAYRQAANQPPQLRFPLGNRLAQCNCNGVPVAQPTQAFQQPAFQPQTGYAGAGQAAYSVQPGIGVPQFNQTGGSWWSPFVSGSGYYTPLLNFRNMPPGTYLGQGIIGQPTAYVDGQPVRNLLRYVSP